MSDAPHAPSSARGALALVAGAVFFAVMAICVKYASRRLPAGEIVMLRFLMGLAVLHALSACRLIHISHERFRPLMVRGISGGLAILFYFLSIKYTTLTKATLIGNAYPVFAALFGVVLLGERLTLSTLGVFAATGVGLWLVVDPKIDTLVVGDVYGVGSAIFAGLAIAQIRELRRTENAFTIFWYLCAAGAALGAATCVRSFVLPAGTDWLWLLAMGASSIAGQLITTYGFRWAPAGEGSLIAMSTVAYSALFGWVFLGDRLTATGLLGAGIVLGGACWLALRSANTDS